MARKGENIFKRKDGRWEGRYIKAHKNGKAVYGFVFGKSYSEAKEKKMAAVAALKKEDNSSTPNNVQPTLKEIGTLWLEDLSSIRKKATLVKYSNQLEHHILPYFGDMRINTIENQDLITC